MDGEDILIQVKRPPIALLSGSWLFTKYLPSDDRIDVGW